MIRSIRGYPLLSGVRGEAAVDVAALEESLLRLSQLVTEQGRIEALDVNPFIVRAAGQPSVAVDARVRIRLP